VLGPKLGQRFPGRPDVLGLRLGQAFEDRRQVLHFPQPLHERLIRLRILDTTAGRRFTVSTSGLFDPFSFSIKAFACRWNSVSEWMSLTLAMPPPLRA